MIYNVLIQNHRPIHFACWNGNTEIVKLLLEKDCDIESTDEMVRNIHTPDNMLLATLSNLMICRLQIR